MQTAEGYATLFFDALVPASVTRETRGWLRKFKASSSAHVHAVVEAMKLVCRPPSYASLF